MEFNRNFFLAIALSIVILIGWQYFFMGPRLEAQQEQARIEAELNEQNGVVPSQPAADGQAATVIPGSQNAAQQQEISREAAIAAGQRIEIDTPNLAGTINLVGGKIDDLSLKEYHTTVDENSPIIKLLNPDVLENGYFAELGYIPSDTSGFVPRNDTQWQVEGNNRLTPTTPVTLVYENDKGILFTRTISVDEDFMFTINDTVENTSGEAISLSPYGRVTRYSLPENASANYLLHEGPIGYIGNQGLQEVSYKELDDLADQDSQIQTYSTTSGGWLGITDKYWAVALIPPQDENYAAAFRLGSPRKFYQTEFAGTAKVIAAGETLELTNRVFAGAKQVSIIKAYESQYNIRNFELLIDWGMLKFITKPMFYVIDWLYNMVGNFGVAILLVTVLLKIVFFPLANKSYKSMARMKLVQPAMVEIREKYADDRAKQQQELMALYKTEKINPLAGCWPILVQFPIFFALYKVLYITIEMRHAPFFGWIQDLAAPDPTSIFNLFGLLPWGVPAFLMIGAWPIIMGITMFLQMRMNPTPPDPTQAMIFTWMPLVFTWMLAAFPAGLVIYWAWNNTLSIIQQAIIMKKQGVKIELFDNLKGVFKRKPKQASEK